MEQLLWLQCCVPVTPLVSNRHRGSSLRTPLTWHCPASPGHLALPHGNTASSQQNLSPQGLLIMNQILSPTCPDTMGTATGEKPKWFERQEMHLILLKGKEYPELPGWRGNNSFSPGSYSCERAKLESVGVNRLSCHCRNNEFPVRAVSNNSSQCFLGCVWLYQWE